MINIEKRKFHLKCPICNSEYESIESNTCPKCGAPLEPIYNYDTIQRTINKDTLSDRKPSMLKYIELLPIAPREIIQLPTLGEGWTPLLNLRKLGKNLGGLNLFGKNETLNPTGSFVDRGVVLDTFNAIKHNYKTLTVISSGNLAVSTTAYARRANLKSHIIVVGKIELGKLYQILAYNADIELANNYEEALEKFKNLKKTYLIDTGNPYYNEGLKTIAFEIIEQLNWNQPDFIIIPTGSGALFHSIWRGFNEFKKVGIIDEIETKFVSVQIDQCKQPNLLGEEKRVFPIESASFLDLCPIKATHLSVVSRDLELNQGIKLTVKETEVLKYLNEIIRSTGLLLEPASATVFLAYKQLINDGVIDSTDNVATVLTGGGLKNFAFLRSIPSKEKDILIRFMEEAFQDYGKGEIGRTKKLILRIIKECNSCHGFGILKKLRDKFNLRITTATLYQHLRELEEKGYITVDSIETVGKRKRKKYKLTTLGSKMLEQ